MRVTGELLWRCATWRQSAKLGEQGPWRRIHRDPGHRGGLTVTFMHADKESHIVHVVTASQQRNTILRYALIL